ncbi:dynamin family protein [Bacillus sp. V3B]|uniref:dynamin family protein n=1 Tax=Bacillus sp. V3B TaxID=2804915 RepID=UPI00210E87CD|nr:dynamin family protein [Bacillus sp. V3B]
MNKSELSERISLLLDKYRDDLFFGEEIQLLQQRIHNVESSIVVVGQFSVGKSELLNALLGEKLLAARRIESTKVTTRIHKCVTEEQRKIILHYKNGETKELSIKDIDILDQYTTFQGSAETEVLLSVDVYWPLKFLNHELLLVDTPGANSLTESAFAVTEKELEKASSVLYLFNGQKGVDQTDLALLMDLMKRRKKVFIVATHIDGLTNEELTSVINSVQDKFAQNMDGLESVEIHPVSSTEALQARQQGNHSLLEQSNIQELEQALISYMGNQEYLASDLESIHYDLEMLEASILESEEEEREEHDERERQRELRIQRLQLLTKREYDLVREYGFDLLVYRDKRILQFLERWKEKIDKNNKGYKKEIALSFRRFRKNIIQEMRVTTFSIDNLKKEYLQHNEKMNDRYKGIIDEFEKLIVLLHQYVKRIIQEEDALFIDNLEANKQNIQLNWPTFKQQIKQMVLNERSIEYEKELFIDYEQDRKELKGSYSKKQQKLEQIKIKQVRAEQENAESLQSLKESHDRRMKGFGNMPDPIKETKTKGVLWWKKEEVVGYDYSPQKQWKAELQRVQKDYKKTVDNRLSDFENLSSELKMNEKKLMSDLNHLTSEIEELTSKLVDELFESIEDQKKVAQSFYKQVEDEIVALWKVQERNAIEQFNHHTDNVRKQFIRFVEGALQTELQLIK